ncbi:MAG TPA: DUF2891 domain-containing protein [Caulobacter sp.]|nr:DUF2891 domain-containing protein [Caulobacter sp.]
MSSSTELDPEVASRFAAIALGHVRQPWPHKADHVFMSEADVAPHPVFHPIFYGSYDWHSCVHGYWTLATLLRLFPTMEQAPDIRALFDDAFTPVKVAVERAYLDRPGARGFERPYGWAWLLMLQAELLRHDDDWSAHLAPLAQGFADRFHAYLPLAVYPVRTGVHSSTSFAIALGLEYAEEAGDEALAALLVETAGRWHAADADCQAWEPSGEDFLSPALMEAEAMRRVLDPADFPVWFDRFLPRAAMGKPATLFRPATVSDRTDGKIAHLDGLNLSRAWCWRAIAAALPGGHPAGPLALRAAEEHLAAGLPHVAGDYMGEHWLASFALLALREPIRV